MRRSKDLQPLREADSANKQHKSNRAFLRDYSLNHRVEVVWNISEEAKKDQIFELHIDDITVLLDAEQVQRAVRWV